ncbi:MAG: hypothetical protein ACREVL_13445 [Solimonas sp.]
MQVFQTVVSGVLVFVLGQILLKMVIEPINKLKQTFATISHAYLIHIKAVYNPVEATDDEKKKAQDDFRLLSGQLCADIRLIPCYGLWRRIFFLPSDAKVYEAARSLIAVGNWIASNNTAKVYHIVKNWQSAADNLGLYIAPESRISDDVLDAGIRNALD